MKTIQKQHRVVLVPTDKETCVYKLLTDIFIFVNKGDKVPILGTYYELYILSDEEIKEGDWFLTIKGNIAKKGGKIISLPTDKKPIATTNSELTADYLPFQEAYTGIPPRKSKVSFPNKNKLSKPIDTFIQQWIDKGCPEIINVEYEEYFDNSSNLAELQHFEFGIKVKISSDNTITCSFIEEERLYTKDEMFKAFKTNFGTGIYGFEAFLRTL